MWHLFETAPLYPDPTVRITQISSTPPVPTTAALPVDYVDLSADEANALLDPYSTLDIRE